MTIDATISKSASPLSAGLDAVPDYLAQTKIDSHVLDQNNPHGVTAEQAGAAPVGLVYGYYAVTTDEQVEEIIQTQIADTTFEANTQRNIVIYNSASGGTFGGRKWFFEFGKSSTNAGYIIAKSYASSQPKIKLRAWTNGVMGDWVDASPSDFAPSGFGLGTLAPKQVTTLDEIGESGFYRFPSPTGSGSAWGICTSFGANTKTLLGFVETYGGLQFRCTRRDGLWGEWEWDNPLMVTGVEYRTTERGAGGKVVYLKRIAYTTTEDIGSTSGTTDTTIPHGIENFNSLVRVHARKSTVVYPMVFSDGGMAMVYKVDSSNITFRSYKSTSSAGTFMFDMYYTKTT